MSAPGDQSGATSYEIFHDRLAAGILDWRRRSVRKRRRRRGVFVALPVLLVAVVAGGWVIYNQHLQNLQNSRDIALLRAQLNERKLFRAKQDHVADQARRSPFFLRILPRHEDVVYTAEFSPDGRRIVTASNDNSVVVAGTTDGTRLHRLSLDTFGGIGRAVFGPHGDVIGIETGDAWAGVSDGHSQRLRFRGVPASTNFNSLTFTQGGRLIVTGTGGGAVLFSNATTGHRVAILKLRRALKDTADTATVSRDGRLAAIGGAGVVRVWDVGTHTLLRTLSLRGKPDDVEFTPDGTALLTITPGRATLWDVHTGQPTQLGGAPPRILTSDEGGTFDDLSRLADFAGENVVIAGTRDVPIWSVRGARRAVLRHSSPTTVARFSPDGRVVVTGTANGVVRAWSVDGRLLAVLLPATRPAKGAAIESLAFGRHGRLLASAGADGMSIVWKLEPDLSVAATTTDSGNGQLIVQARVTNFGLARSPAARLHVLDTRPLAVVNVKPLEPGSSQTLRLVVSLTPGVTPAVRVRVTPADQMSDARPGNNQVQIFHPAGAGG